MIKGDQDQLDEKMNYQVPEITYRIYALDASDISRAIGAFQALCRDETGRHIFDGEEEQELISHLRAEDVCLNMDPSPANYIIHHCQSSSNLLTAHL